MKSVVLNEPGVQVLQSYVFNACSRLEELQVSCISAQVCVFAVECPMSAPTEGRGVSGARAGVRERRAVGIFHECVAACGSPRLNLSEGRVPAVMDVRCDILRQSLRCDELIQLVTRAGVKEESVDVGIGLSGVGSGEQILANPETAFACQHFADAAFFAEPFTHFRCGGVPPFVLSLHEHEPRVRLVRLNNLAELRLRRCNRLDAEGVHAEVQTFNDKFGVRRCRGVDKARLRVVLLFRFRYRCVDTFGEVFGDIALKVGNACARRLKIDVDTRDRS